MSVTAQELKDLVKQLAKGYRDRVLSPEEWASEPETEANRLVREGLMRAVARDQK